jgi:NADPH-dependent 2,4-dienoyl-CoA reductase/sulfur reductase-like enzyme
MDVRFPFEGGTAMTDVLVVGAAAGGLATVEALRRRGFSGPITMLGAEPHLPYDRPPLSKQVLAGDWAPERARLRPEAALAALDVKLALGDPAIAFAAPERRVITATGKTYQAEAVVLATGAVPRRLPGATETYEIRSLEDAVSLRAAVNPGCRLVVVGDGVLGTEIAATAVKLGADVTLAGPQPAPMRLQLGPVVAGLLADLHTTRGVRLRLGAAVTAHVPAPVAVGAGPAGRAAGAVALATGELLPADVVVVAFGAAPATGWLEGSGLTLDDGVVCDEQCRAADGVWAVGDVARWRHLTLGRSVRLENRTNATEQADAVAANILGAATPYTPVPYFWTEQFDVRVQVHGVPVPGAGFEVIEGAPEEGRFVAAYHDAGRPVAVLGWNMPKQARQQRQRLLTLS